jgi:diketogulonate reductase-like aldo/keto reductase
MALRCCLSGSVSSRARQSRRSAPLRRCSGIARSEIFVQTKLWISAYGYESTLRAFDLSLRKLDLDYVDLHLLHWPMPSNFEATVASYRAVERLLAEGRMRAIGVSNFSPMHLSNLVERTEVVPAVNQVELHPFFNQRPLRDAHARLGIVTQAWSPIGGVNRYAADDPDAMKNPLVHPTVTGLAEKYGKTRPPEPPERWVAGADAVQGVTQKADLLHQQANAFPKLSTTLNHA